MSYIVQITASVLLALGAAVAMPSPATAAEGMAMAPGELEWGPVPPVLPPGAEIAILSGNPHEEGIFVLRLKFPAGYTVPAHTHTFAELVTVISGTLNYGHGDMLDRESAQPLEAGAFVDIPAGHPHFVWTDEETVAQVSGEGPFDIEYLDPADDPRI